MSDEREKQLLRDLSLALALGIRLTWCSCGRVKAGGGRGVGPCVH